MLANIVASSFFNAENVKGATARDALAQDVLCHAFIWLKTQTGGVALFDATNTTDARRSMLVESCEKESVPILFLESICDDPFV